MSVDVAVTEFLHSECALLDAGRFEAWVALFDDDGWYWWPAAPGQLSPESGLSIIHEDRRLLELRARRLVHPAIHVQHPPLRTHHHLSAIRVTATLAHEVHVAAMLLVATLRSGEQRLWSAALTYHLRTAGAGFRIRMKRVELLDCDTPLPAIAVPF